MRYRSCEEVRISDVSACSYGYPLTTPNGATLTRTVTRDPYRRSLTLDCTTRFNNVVVATFSYTFDENNRPVSRNNDRFTYNMRDEILSAVIGTNRISHAYDTIGNHVFCAYNAAINFYANNQLNQTTASYACVPSVGSSGNAAPPLFDGYDILSTNKFTWSTQGGLQRDGRFIYAFDAEDQLVSVTSSVLSNGAIRVVNAYDYRHRRISKTVYTMRDDSPPPSPLAPPLPIAHRSWSLQEHHDFVYDDWNLIHETVTAVDANSTTNVTEIEYFWGPDLSNTLQGAGGVGGLLAVSRNGQFYFPVYDNLGNIVKYLDESGKVVAAYSYDDSGRIISSSGSMYDILFFRFSTKYFDSETVLCYYGYRFYSTLPWRCLSRDPLGSRIENNLYGFLMNSSLMTFDCLGLTSVKFKTEFADLDSQRGFVNSLVINAEIVEPPKEGWSLNFIQMKRDFGQQWELDHKLVPGPYYFRMSDARKFTKVDKASGRKSIVLIDAPGGALASRVEFCSAVVEVHRRCWRDTTSVFQEFRCIDRVRVVASVSWSFDPNTIEHYSVPKNTNGEVKPDGLFKRKKMVEVLQQLVNNQTWGNMFCPTSKVEIEDD